MLLASLLLLALSGTLAVPQPAPQHVIGGSVAEDCEWPSTVLMSGCSGTLVHPEVVMYAAHCPNSGSVRFGTDGDERTVATTSCSAAPEYPATGFDYAYCRLAQPVTDVPIVPIMMGCERQQLEVGTRAWLVGFGNTSNAGGGFGTKRWIEGDVAGFPADGKQIGIFYDDVETGICNGDSGGSAFAQLEDGTWRLFGIASTVPGSCGGSSQHVPAWAAVAWIEADSGLDITPCHDADGAWNPGSECGGFPTAPGSDNGLSWGSACGPGPLSDLGASCGAAAGEPQDREAPALSFLQPAAGSHPGPLFETSIELEVIDPGGILDVELSFADETQAFFEAPPYAIPGVSFPDGTWEIVATARDWSRNVSQAAITIEVGAEVGGSSTGETGDDESSSGSPNETSGTGDGSDSDIPSDSAGATTEPADTDTSGLAPSDGSAGGCGCTSGSDSRSWLWLTVLFLAIGRRDVGVAPTRSSRRERRSLPRCDARPAARPPRPRPG